MKWCPAYLIVAWCRRHRRFHSTKVGGSPLSHLHVVRRPLFRQPLRSLAASLTFLARSLACQPLSSGSPGVPDAVAGSLRARLRSNSSPPVPLPLSPTRESRPGALSTSPLVRWRSRSASDSLSVALQREPSRPPAGAREPDSTATRPRAKPPPSPARASSPGAPGVPRQRALARPEPSRNVPQRRTGDGEDGDAGPAKGRGGPHAFPEPEKAAATVRDVLAAYHELHVPNIRPRSQEVFGNYRRELEGLLGDVEAEKLAYDALLRYRQQRRQDYGRRTKRTLSDVTVKKEFSHLRSALRFAKVNRADRVSRV